VCVCVCVCVYCYVLLNFILALEEKWLGGM